MQVAKGQYFPISAYCEVILMWNPFYFAATDITGDIKTRRRHFSATN